MDDRLVDLGSASRLTRATAFDGPTLDGTPGLCPCHNYTHTMSNEAGCTALMPKSRQWDLETLELEE